MKNLTISFLFACIIARCSLKASVKTSEFPLDKGTTWVYAYETYEPIASNPNQIIKATYQVTKTWLKRKPSFLILSRM